MQERTRRTPEEADRNRRPIRSSRVADAATPKAVTGAPAAAGNRVVARLVVGSRTIQRQGPYEDDEEAGGAYSAPHAYDAPANLYASSAYGPATELDDEPEEAAAYDPSKVVKAPTKDSRGNDLRWAGAVPGGGSYKKKWVQQGHGRWAQTWAPQEPAARGGGLHAKLPQTKYEGEEKELGWRQKAWNRPEAERGSDFVTTRHESDPANTAAPLTAGRFGGLETGTQGFVQNPEGGFHTFDPGRVDVLKAGGDTWEAQEGFGSLKEHRKEGNKLKVTHHTTPLAGGAVAAAGMLTTKKGKVTNISDESGHYIPEGEYVNQAVNTIGQAGAFKGGKHYRKQVKLTGYNPHTGQGKGWVGDNPEFYQDDLELPAEAFAQSTGNERQMRLKATLNERLKERVEKVKRHQPSGAAQEQIDAIRSRKEAEEAAAEAEDDTGDAGLGAPDPGITYLLYGGGDDADQYAYAGDAYSGGAGGAETGHAYFRVGGSELDDESED